MDNLTKEQRHKNMSHIRAKDTKIEVALRKALWHRGYRYLKNVTTLPGKPDIVLREPKIVIFCDSEYFHGKDWEVLRPRLEQSANKEYWINKIEHNIKRDKEVEQALNAHGWTVIRFWGKDILKNIDGCINVIEETILELKISQYSANHENKDV